MHIATIVHLTDLHLFVDDSGRTRPVSTRRRGYRLWKLIFNDSSADARRHVTRAVELVPILGKGVNVGQDLQWALLQDSLAALTEGEPVPVAFVHTGDIEAFGSGWGNSGSFPGFKAIHTLRDRIRRPQDAWFDTYGNHDTWFGSPPLPLTNRAQHVANCLSEISTITGLGQPWQAVWAPPMQTAHADIKLQFLRINTVPPGSLAATLARGRVLRHPPPASPTKADTAALLRDLDRLGPRDEGTIRIAMLHHPVHNFGGYVDRFMKVHWTGALKGRTELSSTLQALGFSLVLGGHRHALDPVRGATDVDQPPLDPSILQLVANSPTLASRSPSFSTYAIHVHEPPGTVRIVRRLARYQGVNALFTRGAPDLDIRLSL